MIRLDDFPAVERVLIGAGASTAGVIGLSNVQLYLAIAIGGATFLLIILRCIKVLVETRILLRRQTPPATDQGG